MLALTRRLLVFACASLALVSGCGGSAPASAAHPKLNQEVTLTLPSNDGKLVTVPLRGKRAVVLDFFGPTCKPCEKAVPALQSKRAELAAKGAELVLVAVLGDGENTEQAAAALQKWGVKGASFLVDKNDASRRDLGVHALPSTIVVDDKGVVRWVAPQDASPADVLAAVP